MASLLRLFPCLIISLISLQPALCAGDELKGAVPEGLRADLMHERWDSALDRIDVLLKTQPDDCDLWSYLSAVALDRSGKSEAALGVLRDLVSDHPQSPWVHKARFRQAEIHRAARNFKEAEQIYEEGLTRLRSQDRQGELAEIYIEFADDLSTPAPGVRPDEGELDYSRAADLYLKVLELDTPRSHRDRATYRAAWCLEQMDDARGAMRGYTEYLDAFDPDRQHPLPNGFVAGERVYEARLQLGVNQQGAGQAADARRSLEDLCEDLAAILKDNQHGLSPERVKELTSMHGEARYRIAGTYGADRNSALLAISNLKRFLAEFESHDWATRAAFEVATRSEEIGFWDEAIAAYQEVSERIRPEDSSTQVLEEHAQLTTFAVYRRAVALKGLERYDEALQGFATYTRKFPSGPNWSHSQQGMVDIAYLRGVTYRRLGDYELARSAWVQFLADHPLDSRVQQVQLDMGSLYIEEAEHLLSLDSEAQVDELRKSAVAQWLRLADKYPGTHPASRALYMSGEQLELELDDLSQAIEVYRRCDFGQSSGAAQLRLAGMTEPSLDLSTERVWRTTESPRVLLRLRNIEEYEVKIYRLDLEAYFRKHLTHRRIEDLDLDLIAPDERREERVEEYAQYAPLERHIELACDGPGVWAVAVTADDLTSTTLVIRSDVEVILKSSRREVFVFAQDMLANQPAAGVQILLGIPQSDGSAAFEELATDASGVARLELESLDVAEQLRVLALREGHFASNGLTLRGLEVAKGLRSRAHIATDRPAYQPGDTVRLRTIIRQVEAGAYTFHEGQIFALSVVDSRGRPLLNESLPLSAFGTLNTTFALPSQAALGQYSILVEGPALPQSVGHFQVDEYQLQKVELTFEHDRSVFYRGETIDVIANARFYYGEPVAHSPIVLTLPDGRQETSETDSKGQVHFSIETRDFPSEGMLAFTGHMRAENVSAQGQVYLATRGYNISLSTSKDVILAGDSFAIDIRTETPDSEGCQRDLHLALFERRSRVGGSWTDDMLAEMDISTGDDGAASWTHSIEKGGHYTVRATGQDRFGNTISRELPIFVSGDNDSTRLRLLTDSTRTEVGRTLEYDLLNRAGAGLALVTIEGESIIDYRLVEIEAGHNRIALDVDHAHFPNFRVSAALMLGNEFFEARADFEVQRALTVNVIPTAERVQPGSKVCVNLEVVDQLGQPVTAELALAVVDAALYEHYSDWAPAIIGFFEEGARRNAGLRTATSCTFSYQGKTVAVAQGVLDEISRQQAVSNGVAERKSSLKRLRALGYASEGDAQDDGISLGRPRRAESQESMFRGRAGLEHLGEANLESLSALGYIGGGGGGGSTQTLTRGKESFSKDKAGFSRDRVRHMLGKDVANKRPNSGPTEPAFDADTAFWTPAVTTNAEGKASLEFELPDKSTRWRITARGVSADTLVGESRSTLVTRSDFFVELLAPKNCVEGDKPGIVARVHNLTGEQGNVRMSLRVSTDEGIRVIPAQVQLDAAHLVQYAFPTLDALAPLDMKLELTAKAQLNNGDQIDAQTREDILVRPYGMEFSASHSGPITDLSTFWLQLPNDRKYSERRLDVYIGPSLDSWLIDAALGRLGFLAPSRHAHSQSQSAIAADLRGTLAVMDGLGRGGRRGHPEYANLRSRAMGLTASLVSAQRQDGGWSWMPGAGSSTPQTSADVVLALGAARTSGLELSPGSLSSAVTYLQNAFRASSGQANEIKATITHALAAVGRGDFGAANRLFRERNALSPAAMAHLCLAFVHMKRVPMASEVARLLEGEMQVSGNSNSATTESYCSVRNNKGWSRSRLGMTALAVSALQGSLPSSPKLREGIEYLLSHRPWVGDAGRGLALLAVASDAQLDAGMASLDPVQLTVGEQEPRLLDLASHPQGLFISIPLQDVREREVRVNLKNLGSGTPQFSASMTGFSTDLHRTRRGEQVFRLSREEYLAMPPIFDGRPLPTGFSVLRSYEEYWTNPVKDLESGSLTHVRLALQRDDREQEADVDYLTLEVPLPAGAQLLEGSLRGGRWTHELRGGSLIIPIGPMRGVVNVEFELLGAHPGQYRVAPPVLRSAYEPERFAIGTSRDLTVLARGESTSDEYRPTPDELYHHGRNLYRSGQADAAHTKLIELYEKYAHNLRDNELKETANMLLYLSIDRANPAAIVSFFEVIKEKDPELFIPFEKVVTIGQAYRELGEYERALLIFLATIDETFGKDLKVAGALRAQGERSGAIDTLQQLCREYPDISSVTDTWLALSDEMLVAAKEAHTDASLKGAGRTQASLTEEGILLLRRLLAMHPTGPLTPAAALNLVSAYLALEDQETTSALAGDMAALFTEPRYADAFTYTRAVAEWHLGHEGAAIELLERIVQAVYKDEHGNVEYSENRDLALYILAQVYHARRDPKLASEYYAQVQGVFSDAAEALAGFEKRELSFDEITTTQPGEPVQLTLVHKNLEEVEVLVYEVDLMTLYLREKNLTNVTSINLAGISPTLRKSVMLEGGDSLRAEETSAELQLKEPGAYLVICRTGSLHTSGLVLVTQLELDVTADLQSGRMRVQALSGASQRYLKDVDVRVIGSANPSFTSGSTDPRGIFVADGVRGAATVIARHGEAHYAFHRGTQTLAQTPQPPAAAQAGQADVYGQQMERSAYFSNVMEMNRGIQSSRSGKLQERIKRDRKGVQVQSVK